jgi:hypothetical protein
MVGSPRGHEIGNLTRTGAEQLRRAGMNIELQEMDAGSVVRKRNNQGPPDKGGYNMFCTLTGLCRTSILTATWPSAPTARSR